MKSNIRNFCIIAHIDHGKSTLADRMLELTGTIAKEKMSEQYLDRMDIERERGITIKLQPVRMKWHPRITSYKLPVTNRLEIGSRKPETAGSEYILNLIDTPGHVDFSYEVSRSLAAVEGALLVVDASQGIEAQTLSNAYLAVEQGLTIIPVINKIDLPHAEPEKIAQALCDTFGFRREEIIFVSAKTGKNVEQILDAVVKRVPAPSGNEEGVVRALIFDSNYDKFKGVISHIRIVDGRMYAHQQYQLVATKNTFMALEVGIFSPDFVAKDTVIAGEIGYVATGLKEVGQARVGDTITLAQAHVDPLPGYKTITPMVFAGMYPIESNDYPKLREAVEKLKLNDASLQFALESSQALGFGLRCGFLGLLHMDVVRERLEREYNLSLLLTAPSVRYEVETTDGKIEEIDNPTKLPDRTYTKEIREPWVAATIVSTQTYLGNIMELVNKRRGIIENIEYLGGGSTSTPTEEAISIQSVIPAQPGNSQGSEKADPHLHGDDKYGSRDDRQESRVKITAKLPLAEIITDFFDVLKSISSGYASLDYAYIGLQPVDAIKLEILVGGEVVDAFARIVVASEAPRIGREIVERLKEVIPRQQFEVAIQAALGGSNGQVGKIVARADVRAFRKDVTGNMYGGDRTRKDKLLDKQKAGKKRMKRIGKIDLPQEAFLTVLKQ